MRLLREIITQNDIDAEAEMDNLDLSTTDDDKTFAAMGVAKTIGTVSVWSFPNICLGFIFFRLFPQWIMPRTSSHKSRISSFQLSVSL